MVSKHFENIRNNLQLLNYMKISIYMCHLPAFLSDFSSCYALQGVDWPEAAMSMVGVARMEALHELLHGAYLEKRLQGQAYPPPLTPTLHPQPPYPTIN